MNTLVLIGLVFILMLIGECIWAGMEHAEWKREQRETWEEHEK